MPGRQQVARKLLHCPRATQSSCYIQRATRSFTTSPQCLNEAEAAVRTVTWDPNTVVSPRGERALFRQGIKPVGSRRRRAAIKSSQNIPFEQLPYQCFQEARKVLLADREEKLKLIATERLRIRNLETQDVANVKGGEEKRVERLDSMRRHLSWLKIQADMNDPLIKKKFEDGDGDMDKPIYRYLADRKWRSYKRLITIQRAEQLNVVPDILPGFNPTVEVQMAFRTHNVQPGQFVDSRISEVPPRLRVQFFDKGERLITVMAIDSDVPVLEADTFTSRCHFMAVNIPISPTMTSLPFSKVTNEQLILPWTPPYSQKGSPYHRLTVLVLEQNGNKPIPAENLKTEGPHKVIREDFVARRWLSRLNLKPVGMSIFRCEWDEGTKDVMDRAGIPGADIEFRRSKVEAIKPKQRKRGWEARHTGPKYRSIGRGGDWGDYN